MKIALIVIGMVLIIIMAGVYCAIRLADIMDGEDDEQRNSSK